LRKVLKEVRRLVWKKEKKKEHGRGGQGGRGGLYKQTEQVAKTRCVRG